MPVTLPTDLIPLLDLGPALAVYASLVAARLALTMVPVTRPDPNLPTLLFSLMLDQPHCFWLTWPCTALLTLVKYMGPYLPCGHPQLLSLYRAAIPHCFLISLLCFWLWEPWGHYRALTNPDQPHLQAPTNPAQGPGALFKFSLGLPALLSEMMLWDAGLQFSYSPDLATSPANPDLHTDSLSWPQPCLIIVNLPDDLDSWGILAPSPGIPYSGTTRWVLARKAPALLALVSPFAPWPLGSSWPLLRSDHGFAPLSGVSPTPFSPLLLSLSYLFKTTKQKILRQFLRQLHWLSK